MAASSSSSEPPLPAAPAETESVENKVARLKNDMLRLVNLICEADEYSFDTLHEAVNVMLSLKEYRSRLASYHETEKKIEADFDIPESFKCPISHQLMRDPVVLSNGETCDREYIEQWLSEGKRTSPNSDEVILHTMLVSNDLVRDMISKWKRELGRMPQQAVLDIDEAITEDELARAEAGNLDVDNLLKTIARCGLDAEKAVKKLRTLVTRSAKFRASLGKSIFAINQIVGPIYSTFDASPLEALRKDLVITLYHLSRCDDNKEVIAKHTPVISVLNESLTLGTNETIRYAAGTMFLLSNVDSTKLVIGAEALKTLLKLLDEGNPWNITIIAAGVNRLCTANINLLTAFHEGATELALKKIKDRILVEEMLELLFKLSAIPQAREEMIRKDVTSCLQGLPSEFPKLSQVERYCLEIDEALNDHLRDPQESNEDSPEGKSKEIFAKFEKMVSIPYE